MLPLASTLLFSLALFQSPTVQVHRSGSVVAETWTAPSSEGGIQDWYRISLDGGETYGRDRQTHYQLMLRYGAFDPLRDTVPEVEPGLTSNTESNRLWIVQYITKGVEPWREELRTLGGVDHRYLGMHANLWAMPAETAAEVAKLPYVRWVGPFHPAYKLENELLAEFRADGFQTRRYNIVVGEWGAGQKASLVAMIEAMDGTVHAAYDQGWIVSATLNGEQLLSVLQSPWVLGVDRWSAPEVDMDKVRIVMGADYLESVGGYTGQGVRAEVMDSGLDTPHTDWANPPIFHTSASSAAHGTCTYGINFGSGASTSGGQSRGVMPDAIGIFADFSSFGSRYTHTAELVNPALQYRAVYQSNSWGGSRTFNYNSESQEMDDIIFINDFSIMQSQSNAGNQDSRPQAWAKNVISVGGVRHGNDLNDNNDSWTGGASIGPAADGRIKPDISAYYDNVWTSDADSGSFGYTGGDDYQGFNGTSAAAPIVAGHIGLIYQMWRNGEFGNPIGAGDVFDNRSHNTTAKALLLNSSKQWNFAGAGHDLTRVHQGWGKPDLRRLYDNRVETFVVDEEVTLEDMESVAWNVTVPSGAVEFRATLVYSDRAGTISSNLHRINDLSLRVTDPSGLVYWGNQGLLTSMVSSSGGTSNTKDTVEQVILASPVAGVWQVDVFADEVNLDSHLETTAVDADFALVVTPVVSYTGIDLLDQITLLGSGTPSAGVPSMYTFSNAPINENVWLLAAPNLNGTVFGGHQFDLGAPVSIAMTSTSNSVGTGSFLLVAPLALIGSTYFLEIASLSAGLWSESAPLQIDIQ